MQTLPRPLTQQEQSWVKEILDVNPEWTDVSVSSIKATEHVSGHDGWKHSQRAISTARPTHAKDYRILAFQVRAGIMIQFRMLREFWKDQGVTASEGASKHDLAAFEALHGVKLPDDLRSYFRTVNGFSELSRHENDSKGFRFLPLSSIKTVADELKCLPPGIPEPQSSDRFFVFAEYLQWSWGYAIRLDQDSTRKTEVIHVGGLASPVLSTTFSDFIRLYLENDSRLYPSS